MQLAVVVAITLPPLDSPPERTCPTLVDHSEILQLTGFLVLKAVDPDCPYPELPLGLEDVHTFGGTTGIHRVLWQGNDSLHQIELTAATGRKSFRYVFKFTVSPPARPGFESVRELFDGRTVTQYYVWRVEQDSAAEGEEVVIRSNTDPFTGEVSSP